MTSVNDWLRSLGLERYARVFHDHDIDASVLPRLTADDLARIGVASIGHRLKLLTAIESLVGSASSAMAPIKTGLLQTAAPTKFIDAERRQLTIMFCDLVGSTTLSSRLDPEDLREVISAYQAAVSEEIRRYGGYVAKYLGDGVLAYFGYPSAHEDDSERAARAGLAVAEKVPRLDTTVPLQSRIGIATGLVVVGDLIGIGEAQERSVVGETPNLAARLQELAPPNTVLIADSTRELLGDLFELRDLGTVGLKGFEAAARVWQVLQPSMIESRFDALRTAHKTPLVGRETELDLLLRCWTRARSGDGQIALISGEPGLGKSRIAVELQERLQGEPKLVLRYFCSPHHHDNALYPVLAQIRHAAGITREDAPGVQIDKIATLLAQSGDVTPEVVAVFCDLFGLTETSATLPADPRRKRELTLNMLISRLVRLAQQQSILLVFEDAHWTDPTSLELLERLAELVPKLPVLMVLTFRPEFDPPWTKQTHVTSLDLSLLRQQHIASIVQSISGGKHFPAEVLGGIVERCGGVPLFAEELTRTLLESGLLHLEEDRYVTAGPVPAQVIPSSLHDSLMARLDRLGAAKEVAQIGAAIGREFSFDLLAAILRGSNDELREALDQLVDSGLVDRQAHGSLVFKHVLIQDAAYESLLRARRRTLHVEIAEALEEQLANASEKQITAGEQATQLAHHWLRAERWEKALHCTLQAAEWARKLYARPEAIGQYWQALTLLERLPRSQELSRIRIDVILQLVQLPGWVRDETGKARMLPHLDQSLADAVADKQLATLARLETIKGRNWEDEALLQQATAHAEASDDPLALGFATFGYGAYLGECAKFEKALSHLARAIEITGAHGRPLDQAFMMAGPGRCFNARAGRLDQSLAYAVGARRVGEETGDALLLAWRAMEAEPHFYRGHWRDAVQAAEEALPVAWEIREWAVILWSSAWLAIAHLKLAQTAESQQVLSRAFDEVPARALGFHAYAIPYAHVALAQLHLTTGNTDDAMKSARRALDASQGSRFRLEAGAAYRVLGEVHEACGARSEADTAFRRSLTILNEIQCPPELGQTLLAYGRFRLPDDPREGHALIERSGSLFKTIGATGWMKEVQAALN